MFNLNICFSFTLVFYVFKSLEKHCMVKGIFILKTHNYNTVILPSEGNLRLAIYSRLMNSSLLGHKEVW